MAVLTLELPLPPNAANSRRHWRVALKEKKAYWDRCNILLAMRRLPTPPVRPPKRVRAAAVLYLHSYMDDDNAMARLKPAVDWIKGHGYMVDDSRRNLEWAGLPEQAIDRKNPRLVITLEAA